MPKNNLVEVGVSVSNASTGKLEIKVKPWAVKVGSHDTVEWKPVVHNGDDIVQWIRIDSFVPPSAWPFPTSPPDAAYTGNKAKPPKTPKPRKAGLPVGTKIRYIMTVAFLDDDGNERVATIDPDMVIDT